MAESVVESSLAPDTFGVSRAMALGTSQFNPYYI